MRFFSLCMADLWLLPLPLWGEFSMSLGKSLVNFLKRTFNPPLMGISGAGNFSSRDRSQESESKRKQLYLCWSFLSSLLHEGERQSKTLSLPLSVERLSVMLCSVSLSAVIAASGLCLLSASWCSCCHLQRGWLEQSEVNLSY